MPTLQRRGDGGFVIHHFYRDHATWQILGEGVRYLKRRGIQEGIRFSTGIFIALWTLGLVYHGDILPDQAAPPPDVGEGAVLRGCVQAFHRFLYSRQADAAWLFVWDLGDPTFEEFSSQISLGCYNFVSWRIKDLELRNGGRSANVWVEIGLADLDKRETEQLWVKGEGLWQIFWTGFDV